MHSPAPLRTAWLFSLQAPLHPLNEKSNPLLQSHGCVNKYYKSLKLSVPLADCREEAERQQMSILALACLGLRQQATRYKTPRAPVDSHLPAQWIYRALVEHISKGTQTLTARNSCATEKVYPSISCLLYFPRTCTICMLFCKPLNSLKAVDQDCEEDYTELFVSADQYKRRAGRF